MENKTIRNSDHNVVKFNITEKKYEKIRQILDFRELMKLSMLIREQEVRGNEVKFLAV